MYICIENFNNFADLHINLQIKIIPSFISTMFGSLKCNKVVLISYCVALSVNEGCASFLPF